MWMYLPLGSGLVTFLGPSSRQQVAEKGPRMIDVETEDLLTLCRAAAEIPNRASGRGVNTSTVWRWAQRGVRGVRLETVLIGSIRFTSRQAIKRFFAATTAAANGEVAPIPTDKQRQRAIEAANRALDAAGI